MQNCSSKVAAAIKALEGGKITYRMLQRCGVLSLPPVQPARAQSPHPPQPPAGSQEFKHRRGHWQALCHGRTCARVQRGANTQQAGCSACKTGTGESHPLSASEHSAGISAPQDSCIALFSVVCWLRRIHPTQQICSCRQSVCPSSPMLAGSARLGTAYAACHRALQLAQWADHRKLRTLTGSRTCTVSSSSLSPRLDAS